MILRFNKSYPIFEQRISTLARGFKNGPGANRRHQQQKIQSYLAERRTMYEKLTLNSYLGVCIDVGQINRAFNLLLWHSRPKQRPIADVEHYNIVLKGWAKLNSKPQISETLMHMSRNNIQPNAETFLYILLGHASRGATRLTNVEVKKIIRHMKIRNIDPKTIFQYAYLGANERKSVIKLLQNFDPQYDDAFFSEPLNYKCHLAQNIKSIEPKPYSFAGDADLSKLESWADHQRTVEWKPSVTIKSVANIKDSPAALGKYLKIWQTLYEIWRKALTKSLDESLNTLQAQCSDSGKIHLYPYLCTIDRSMLVNLMLDEIETNAVFSTYSCSTNLLHLEFGSKVMIRYMRAKAMADGSHYEIQRIYNEYLSEYCRNPRMMSQLTSREFIQKKAIETKNYAVYKSRYSRVEQWPHHITAAVGRFLYGIILREVKFDPNVVSGIKRDIDPNKMIHAFYTAYFQIDNSHKIKEEFRAHQVFERLHQRACASRLKFDYSYLPTSSPPLPWLSDDLGGYLTYKSDLVRTSHPSAEQQFIKRQDLDYQKLYPSLDSLNAIGLCPWIVNKDVLDVVIELFKSGGNTDLAVPLDETKMELQAPVLGENASKADRILYNRQKKRYDQKRMEMYSLWRSCLYRLSIANHFRDRIFWFPHNMDFRGRTYPIPPHFNHLGADLARALLLFAKGRPLGERGLDWLKIHLVNLVGKMKSCSMQERLDYANSILHLEILDSADNPWDGRRWWMDNENPWQVLACCKEIAKAIRSRDFKQYVSHFSVHQDGSCNGLQHYAALGRDQDGGKAVNLVPCEKPQDVYNRVVNIVEEMRKKDSEKGDKIAESLDGFIQRKVIKQTVMTTVYGVTRYGARHQIARQLQAKGFPEQSVWKASQYLALKTFASIGQMFNKSRLIQDWFTDCAYIIASKYRQHVSWETPLGFPVTQPYSMPNMNSGNRILSPNISLDVPLFNDPLSRLNPSKQKTAFPPNYIHSLDSSHMMLTSLHCERQGITFVSVHDCFWTHPSTVDKMNQICRQQFVALHSEPLLKNLSEHFIHKFGHYEQEALSELLERQSNSKKKKKREVDLSNQQKKVNLSNQQQKVEVKHKHRIVSGGSFNQQEEFEEELGMTTGAALTNNWTNDNNDIDKHNYDDRDVEEDLRELLASDHKENTNQTLVATNCEPSKTVKPLIHLFSDSHELAHRKSRATFENIPKQGDLNLEEVLISTYFFS